MNNSTKSKTISYLIKTYNNIIGKHGIYIDNDLMSFSFKGFCMQPTATYLYSTLDHSHMPLLWFNTYHVVQFQVLMGHLRPTFKQLNDVLRTMVDKIQETVNSVLFFHNRYQRPSVGSREPSPWPSGFNQIRHASNKCKQTYTNFQ